VQVPGGIRARAPGPPRGGQPLVPGWRAGHIRAAMREPKERLGGAVEVAKVKNGCFVHKEASFLAAKTADFYICAARPCLG
jgi:hypothetical protein